MTWPGDLTCDDPGTQFSEKVRKWWLIRYEKRLWYNLLTRYDKVFSLSRQSARGCSNTPPPQSGAGKKARRNDSGVCYYTCLTKSPANISTLGFWPTKSFANATSLTNVPIAAVETRVNGTLNGAILHVGRFRKWSEKQPSKKDESFFSEDVPKLGEFKLCTLCF